MTAPTADQPRDAGPPDLMAMSLASVAESQFSITDPDPLRWGPSVQINTTPGTSSDGRDAVVDTTHSAVAAMLDALGRREAHASDVQPQGAVIGRPMALDMPWHASPARNEPPPDAA